MINHFFLLAIALFAHSAAAALPSPWPNFRGNSLNSGTSTLRLSEPGKGTARPVSFATRGIIWGTPVIDQDNNIYVGTSAKLFHKLSPAGKELWRYQIKDLPDSLIDSAAALTGTGKVIVPGGDGFLHALDRATGRLLWSFGAHDADAGQAKTGETVNSFEGNVTVAGGRIYAGCDNGYLYALDDEGHKLWSFRTGLMVWSSPAFARDGSWMAVGSLDRNLYLLDPRSGKLLAKLPTGGDIKSSPATDGDTIYVGTSAEEILAVSVHGSAKGLTLERRWTYPAKGEVYSSPAVKDGTVYIGTLRGYFYALDAGTGQPRWTFETRSPIASSPALSADGAVIFGAKNSKLYALNAATGERRWSYRTSDSLYKSNLDSSPSLLRAPDGATLVAAGSYGGKVFLVPGTYCDHALADPLCERGGREDNVAHEGALGPDEAALRYVDRDGRLLTGSHEKVGLFEPIQLQLLASEAGRQVANAAISEFPLHVSVSPNASLRAVVSSDGTLLNLIPLAPLQPGTRYTITVGGYYYRNTHWLWNRLKWLGLRSFSGDVTVETAPASTAMATDKPFRLWGVHSMYLSQPQALDTYIPAALDGQAFLVSGFGFRPDGKFLLLAQPALPSAARPIPLAEASKSFVLEAESAGRNFVARGSMAIAAMGGAMKFDEAQLTGSFSEQGGIDRGEFFVNSSCLGIKGNGSDYQFPLSLVSWVCDARLHVIGLGPLSGEEWEPAPAAKGLTVSLGKELVIRDPGGSLRRNAPHLVNVVEYDPDSAKVLRFEALDAAPACWTAEAECRLTVTPGARAARGKTLVFVDQTPISL